MKKYIIFSLAIFALVLVFTIRHFKSPSPSSQSFQNNSDQPAIEQATAINGNLVSPQTAASRPLAVIVENHPDAWPQSGLSEADVVYETLAEGGITRFLALFQSHDAKLIGPVRSAREYFAEIANEWGALFAHVGGSNEVINQLKNNAFKNVSDANEYYNFDFFPRQKNKVQPHHIFTSVQKLRELIVFHKYESTTNYQPWQFKDDQPAASSTASRIDIDFSRAGYEAGWVYNKANNVYERLQYFQPQIDEASGKQIVAKNIVAQLVSVVPVPNDKLLHVNIDMDSGGKAVIFLDGQAIVGKWKKENNRTRYYNEVGEEIKFNRGLIWVELVPTNKENGLVWK